MSVSFLTKGMATENPNSKRHDTKNGFKISAPSFSFIDKSESIVAVYVMLEHIVVNAKKIVSAPKITENNSYTRPSIANVREFFY